MRGVPPKSSRRGRKRRGPTHREPDVTDKPEPKPADKPFPPTEGEFKAFVGRVLSVPKSEAERRDEKSNELK